MPANPDTPGHLIASRGNMVVVTMHYRLAELGWLTHPKLRSGTDEHPLDDSGNYGLLDIIANLRWVRDNVSGFGGNPDNVFIAGESAGGHNVLCLLTSPAAKGLFHKAMAQSGNRGGITMAQADRGAARTIRTLMRQDGSAANDDDARKKLAAMPAAELQRYLRDKPFTAFLRARPEGGSPAVSYLDGHVLPLEGAASFEAGTYASRVPTIIGMNKEEAKLHLFVNRAYRRLDAETYEASSVYSSDTRRALACDSILRAMRSHADQPPVYGYQFLWGYAGDGDSAIPPPFDARLGSYHALDVAFFWSSTKTTCRDGGSWPKP